MIYLTPEQVKARVRGPRSALRVTIQHWKQNTRLTEDQLADFRTLDYQGPIAAKLCGLCVYYHNKSSCQHCPLRKKYYCFNDTSPYVKARNIWYRVPWDYPAFIAASKKMVEVLGGVG